MYSIAKVNAGGTITPRSLAGPQLPCSLYEDSIGKGSVTSIRRNKFIELNNHPRVRSMRPKFMLFATLHRDADITPCADLIYVLPA